LLSRTKSHQSAYSVIKVDEKVLPELLEKLIQIDEIQSIKQIII